MYEFDITVIIPAYNEEKTIGTTVKALKRISYIDKILVVDDGSTDSTVSEAVINGADVLRLITNAGKAQAMKKGYEAAKSSVLVFLDADLGDSAEEAIKLIKPICLNKADVTVANFPMTTGKGGFGFVKGLSAWGLNILTGKSFPSVLSGQRGFKRSVLSEEYFRYSGFGVEFGMTVDMLINGIKLLEVDVLMTHRTTDRDLKGFMHRYHQFMDILKVIGKKMLENSFIKLKINNPED